eukprot:350730-Chlamydomonas_euryale.AAC.6
MPEVSGLTLSSSNLPLRPRGLLSGLPPPRRAAASAGRQGRGSRVSRGRRLARPSPRRSARPSTCRRIVGARHTWQQGGVQRRGCHGRRTDSRGVCMGRRHGRTAANSHPGADTAAAVQGSHSCLGAAG